MTARALAIFAIIVGAIGLILAAVPNVPRAVEAVVGLVIVLLAPGLALLLALRVPPRGGGTTVVLVLGGSVALLVVVGVVLAALPLGLTTTSGPVTLEIVSVILAASALGRRSAPEVLVTRPALSVSSWPGAVLLPLSLVVALAAVVIGHVAADRTDADARVTEFSATPASGGSALRVLIVNHQLHATSFRVRVTSRAAGSSEQTFATRSLEVARGDRTTARIALPDRVSAVSVVTSLYVAGRTKSIRVVGAAP